MNKANLKSGFALFLMIEDDEDGLEPSSHVVSSTHFPSNLDWKQQKTKETKQKIITTMDDREDRAELPIAWSPVLEILSMHTKYSEVFKESIQVIFYGGGSLSEPERHYLAIMAASRHHCDLIMNIHAVEFERTGGNIEWLEGLQHVKNSRIPTLDTLNMILAHQPWRVNAECIRDLIRTSPPPFTLCDIVTAAVIMSHTHCLCGLVHAVGKSAIPPNSRHPSGSAFEWAARDKENKIAQQTSEVEELLKKMANIKTSGDVDININTKHFMALTADSNDVTSGSESPDRSDRPVFSSQVPFSYVDFASRTDSTRTFKSHEFTWEHAYSVLEDVTREIAPALDRKFNETRCLTYGFMGGFDNVDTTGYRNAIWNYIQALFGIRHDDYDYSAVNQLLSREMKTFIKNIACSPHRLPAELRESVMREFKNSEKVHVVMMITEARLQACMLWLSRAVSNFYVLAVSRHDSRELD